REVSLIVRSVPRHLNKGQLLLGACSRSFSGLAFTNETDARRCQRSGHRGLGTSAFAPPTTTPSIRSTGPASGQETPILGFQTRNPSRFPDWTFIWSRATLPPRITVRRPGK